MCLNDVNPRLELHHNLNYPLSPTSLSPPVAALTPLPLFNTSQHHRQHCQAHSLPNHRHHFKSMSNITLKLQPGAVSLIIAGKLKSVEEVSKFAPSVVKWLKESLPLAHQDKVRPCLCLCAACRILDTSLLTSISPGNG